MRFDGRLRVFPEPTVAADPSEEAFDHPAPRLDCEADLIGLSLDDRVTILDAGRMGQQHQRPTVGVDQRVALAALDFLASVIAARSAALAGLDRLAVDGRRRG